MIFKKISVSPKDLSVELSTVIAHCPLAKSFLHLGSHDGHICQAVSAFLQFDHVIGLDNDPAKMALALARKKQFADKMYATEFYFHHFAYPFRELQSTTLAMLSCLDLPMPTQFQLCHWLSQTAYIHTIASGVSLPLHSKLWFVRSIEEINGASFYIYQRIMPNVA